MLFFSIKSAPPFHSTPPPTFWSARAMTVLWRIALFGGPQTAEPAKPTAKRKTGKLGAKRRTMQKKEEEEKKNEGGSLWRYHHSDELQCP